MCCKCWVAVEEISPECGKEKQEINDLNRIIAWDPATLALTLESWWAKPEWCHVQQKQVPPSSYGTGWHRSAHEVQFLYFCHLLRDLRSSCSSLPDIPCLLFFPSACNKVSAVLICGLELALQCVLPHCKIPVLINSIWTAVSPDVSASAGPHTEYIRCSSFVTALCWNSSV